MADEENGDQPSLDLAQILQTLANLPRTQSAAPGSQQQQHPYLSQDQGQTELPASHHPAQTGIPFGHEQYLDPRLSGRPAPQNRQPPAIQDRASTPTVDPATITEWKQGLRCVTKTATQNPSFVATVQKLMKDQERNVKDWEAGRQRLLDDQEAKRENEQMHRALSLPGLLDNTTPLRTPEREMEELGEYDQKVYRASRRMVESQSAQLKSLGVPFFGVEEGTIAKEELLELQRKMLNHLTEMYGD